MPSTTLGNRCTRHVPPWLLAAMHVLSVSVLPVDAQSTPTADTTHTECTPTTQPQTQPTTSLRVLHLGSDEEQLKDSQDNLIAVIQPRRDAYVNLPPDRTLHVCRRIYVVPEKVLEREAPIFSVCSPEGMVGDAARRLQAEVRVNGQLAAYAEYSPGRFRNAHADAVSLWRCRNNESSLLAPRVASGGSIHMLGEAGVGHYSVAAAESAAGCSERALHNFTVDHSSYTYPYTNDESRKGKRASAAWDAESRAMETYAARYGREWVAAWPRRPPRASILSQFGSNADVGATQLVQTNVAAPDGCCGDLVVKVASAHPSLWSIRRLLSDEECDHLQSLGSERMGNESVALVPLKADSNTERVVKRIGALLGSRRAVPSEPIHIVRYGAGRGGGSPHYDWGVETKVTRLASVVVFLSDVAEGGELVFPFAASDENVYMPKRGSALILRNLLEDGNGDIDAMYAHLPVVKGEAWVASFYVNDP